MASEDEKDNDQLDEFSNHLTNTVDIVENILIYLNAQNLNRSARVCSFWAKIVKRLKRKRKTRSWTCLGRFLDDDDLMNDVTLQTQNFIQDLYTEPDIVFVICTADLLHLKTDIPGQTRSGRLTRGSTQSYQEFLCSLLPQSCKLCGIESNGIIGTTSDCKKSIEIEDNDGDIKGVSFLCLPKYDGVNIDICNITEGSDIQLEEYVKRYEVPVSPVCRLILMMVAEFQTPRRYGFELRKAAPDALVAGAFVDEVFVQDLDENIFLQLLSIHGDKVQVASVIINETIDFPADAEECIKKLKSHNLPEDNSFAFMLACVGRGEGLYEESNVESALFRKYFPKTPLIGLFGNGEIGFDHVNKGSPTIEEEPECKKKKSQVKLYHSFTTVLVLVSVT